MATAWRQIAGIDRARALNPAGGVASRPSPADVRAAGTGSDGLRDPASKVGGMSGRASFGPGAVAPAVRSTGRRKACRDVDAPVDHPLDRIRRQTGLLGPCRRILDEPRRSPNAPVVFGRPGLAAITRKGRHGPCPETGMTPESVSGIRRKAEGRASTRGTIGLMVAGMASPRNLRTLEVEDGLLDVTPEFRNDLNASASLRRLAPECPAANPEPPRECAARDPRRLELACSG